jgi:hypothetical protein
LWENDVKFEPDVARDILLAMESHPRSDLLGEAPTIPGDRDYEVLCHHYHLLHEDGFIEALDYTGGDFLECIPLRMTRDGYRYLESVRDDRNYRKAIAHVNEHGIPMTLKIIWDVLKGQTGL